MIDVADRWGFALGVCCSSIPTLVILLAVWALVVLPTIRWLNRTWLDREWRMARRIRRKLKHFSFPNARLGTQFPETPVSGTVEPQSAHAVQSEPAKQGFREGVSGGRHEQGLDPVSPS